MSFSSVPLGMVGVGGTFGLNVSAVTGAAGTIPTVTLVNRHGSTPVPGIANGSRFAIGGLHAANIPEALNGDWEVRRAPGVVTGQAFQLIGSRPVPAAGLGTVTLTNARVATLVDETPFLNSDGLAILMTYSGFSGQAQVLGLDVEGNYYSSAAATHTAPGPNLLGDVRTGWVDLRVQAGCDPLPVVTTTTETFVFGIGSTRRLAMRAVSLTAGNVSATAFSA